MRVEDENRKGEIGFGLGNNLVIEETISSNKR